MRSQILDKNFQTISDREVKEKTKARVTYARVKYFEHKDVLPKSEVVPAHFVFPQ